MRSAALRRRPYDARRARAFAAALAVSLAAGCVTVSDDGGFRSVQNLVRERLGKEVKWVRSREDAGEVNAALQKLIAQPLTVDAAVQIALLNNRGLQAAYAGLARRGFEERAGAEVMQVAADTRRAWVSAVAAQESVTYTQQVRLAAEAAALLTRRMAAVGNSSRLDYAREQVFYTEASAQLARARQSALAERERLTQLMGLWGEDARYTLPARLPELPKTPREIADLEGEAVRQRLDVQSAVKEARSLSGAPRAAAADRAAGAAIQARSEARVAYAAYRTAFDIAQHYRDEIVPLRKTIAEENLLRYNGMLISVFDLLADARLQVAAVNAYLEALRDFWLADANLELALRGKPLGTVEK